MYLFIFLLKIELVSTNDIKLNEGFDDLKD